MSKRPVLHGEIVGRRGWRVHKGSSLLESSWAKRTWVPGENRAFCLRERHPTPHPRCECGLYAVYSPETVITFMQGAVMPGLASLAIVGLVTAWGDIEVHIDGFRASNARVAALVDDKRLPPGLAQRMAELYGVPLISWDDWLDDAFVAEFGETIPRELRPRVGERRGIRSGRRDQGVRLIYGLAGVAALLMATLDTWIPVIALCWIVVAMVLSTFRWPDWWDE